MPLQNLTGCVDLSLQLTKHTLFWLEQPENLSFYLKPSSVAHAKIQKRGLDQVVPHQPCQRQLSQQIHQHESAFLVSYLSGTLSQSWVRRCRSETPQHSSLLSLFGCSRLDSSPLKWGVLRGLRGSSQEEGREKEFQEKPFSNSSVGILP